MLWTNFILQKTRKENNSINTDDRVMVLAFCTFSHSPLSVYKVSITCSYLQYFKRYAPAKSVTEEQVATICSPFGEHNKKFK